VLPGGKAGTHALPGKSGVPWKKGGTGAAVEAGCSGFSADAAAGRIGYKGTSVSGEPFELIEVRAFGYMAEEVAARVSAAAGGRGAVGAGGMCSGQPIGVKVGVNVLGGAAGADGGSGEEAAVRSLLYRLTARCIGPISGRPSFGEIVRELSAGT
jgi:hypothetical protein